MKFPILRLFFLILFFGPLAGVAGQESDRAGGDPDERFRMVRDQARDGRPDQALAQGRVLLAEYPDYHDVALYLGRIHGWESQFDSAWSYVDRVMARDSALLDAWLLGVDLAYWQGDARLLERYAQGALALDSTRTDVQEKLDLFRRLPGEEDAVELMVTYGYDHFEQPYLRNWHMVSAGILVPAGKAVLIPSASYGLLPGASGTDTDVQANLQAWLRMGRASYAFAAYGFSPADPLNLFPRHLGGAEYWQSLPRNFYVSGGFRFYAWDRAFVFPTVSLETYMGNSWLSLRSYLYFKGYGPSTSWVLTGRRYFGGRHDFVSLAAGYGTAPDEPYSLESDLDRLNALSLRAGYSKRLNPTFRFQVVAGYAREEYDRQSSRNRFDVNAGVYIRLAK